jgi:hypothetical protein
MTTENDFVPFAAAFDANVETQSEYLADAALGPGVITGLGKSALYNKVARQSSLIASVIAQYIVQQLNVTVIDDGTTATILSNLSKALGSTSFGPKGVTSTSSIVIPAGVYYFQFKDVSGGGGGGGAANSGALGGGGGGSAYVDGGFAVVPGDTITFTIGAGGTGGSGANGGTGGSTTIKHNGTTVLTVTGGDGGILGNGGSGIGGSAGSFSSGSGVAVAVRPGSDGGQGFDVSGDFYSAVGGAPGGAGFTGFKFGPTAQAGAVPYAFGGGGGGGITGGHGAAGLGGNVTYWW